jgi:hypothetical protein
MKLLVSALLLMSLSAQAKDKAKGLKLETECEKKYAAKKKTAADFDRARRELSGEIGDEYRDSEKIQKRINQMMVKRCVRICGEILKGSIGFSTPEYKVAFEEVLRIGDYYDEYMDADIIHFDTVEMLKRDHCPKTLSKIKLKKTK